MSSDNAQADPDERDYIPSTIGPRGRNTIRRSMGPMEPEPGQAQAEPQAQAFDLDELERWFGRIRRRYTEYHNLGAPYQKNSLTLSVKDWGAFWAKGRALIARLREAEQERDKWHTNFEVEFRARTADLDKLERLRERLAEAERLITNLLEASSGDVERIRELEQELAQARGE